MLELILGLRVPHCGLRGIYIGIRSSGMCGRMGEDTDACKFTPVVDRTLNWSFGTAPQKQPERDKNREQKKGKSRE